MSRDNTIYFYRKTRKVAAGSVRPACVWGTVMHTAYASAETERPAAVSV